MAFTTEALVDLGLDKDQIKGVMALKGKAIKESENADELKAERDNLNAQLTQRDKDIKTLQEKAKGNETMELELEALKKSYADDKKKHADELESLKFTNALAAELGKTNARDADDLLRFIDKDAVKYEDGKLIGVSEQITALQGSKPYLFDGKIEQEPYSPNGGANVPPNTKLEEAMKSDGFNFTDFAKSQQGE